MDTDPSAAKAALRTDLLARRGRRSPDEIAVARAAVSAVATAARDRHGWRTVAAYRPLRTEPGSLDLLTALVGAGARVLVPVLRPDRDLDWITWTPGSPVTDDAQWGVEAVATADAVLVPALAVGRDASRLGRGGGSYDRALARVASGTPIAALVYADELLDTVPRQPWDHPVTAAITPGGWLDLPAAPRP